MFLCPPLNVTISFAVPSLVSVPIPSSLSTAVPFSILHSASRYCRLLHIVLQEAYLMALLEGGGGCFPEKVGRRLPTSIEWEHQCAPTSTHGKYMTHDTVDRSFTIFSPKFLGGLLLCINYFLLWLENFRSWLSSISVTSSWKIFLHPVSLLAPILFPCMFYLFICCILFFSSIFTLFIFPPWIFL